MKIWILLLTGFAVLGLSGCKDNDETKLEASLTLKTWEVGNPEIVFGPSKDVFTEREPIAFDLKLTNKGFKTERVEYGSCGFDVIEIHNQNREKVYDSRQAPIGCSATWNIEVVYTGESIGTPTLWDQELFLIDAEGGEIGGTGEYLPPGDYTVTGYAAVKLGSSEANWTIIPLPTEYNLTIEASE